VPRVKNLDYLKSDHSPNVPGVIVGKVTVLNTTTIQPWTKISSILVASISSSSSDSINYFALLGRSFPQSLVPFSLPKPFSDTDSPA